MESGAEIAVGVLVELALASVVGLALFSLWVRVFGGPKRGTVLPYQKGVLMRNGMVLRVVDPGRYWVTANRTLFVCDMRQKPIQVQDADLVTLDGVILRITVVGACRVIDPAAYLAQSSDSFSVFYLELKQALQTSVRETPAQLILEGHSQLTERVRELLIPRSTQLGIELIQLDLLQPFPVGTLRAV